MEYSDLSSGKSKTPYKGLRDYHLRSALTTGNLNKTTFQSWNKRIISEINIFCENYQICERDPCSILGRIFESSPMISTYGPELFHAGKCLEVESKVYSSMEAPLLKKASILLTSSKLETKYFMPSLFFQRAIIISNAKNADKPLPEGVLKTNSDQAIGIVTQHLETIKLTLKISSECFGVILEDNLMSIHHIDHLRNWSDKCTERLNIELSCIFGNQLNPTIYPSIDLIYNFWGIWDSELRINGNTFYKCVKLFEAMVIGVILRKNPNKVITPLSDFLDNTVSDFAKGLDQSLLDLSLVVEKMKVFLLSQSSMQYLSQMYGLYRTWGHPVVSPVSGIRKVKQLGTIKKTISKILPLQIRRVFMLRYAVWFKSTKGSYPECSDYVEELRGNAVRDLIHREASISQLEMTMNLPDWDNIRFKRSTEIPKTFNLSEMVADKSVSPDRSGLYYLCSKSGGVYDANLKRGVLQWLMRDPESCEHFLRRVNDHNLGEDELIIGLYQKEREVNETPRMFALMSHSIRNYIVTTEAMISDDILPAFPNITMTNSLLALQKKIYAVSHKQAQNIQTAGFQTYRDVTIIVNIDFEKWNLNFRRETTFPLFEAMGDIYGLEALYNRTYDIFESSMIYLADGSYKPKINIDTRSFVLEDPFSYIGHVGGFEGLRQKGWTVFTDCGLDLICSRHKCSYTIMGQGDNQVLALTWRTYMLDGEREVNDQGKASLSRQFGMFMADLVQTFGELGLPVKALETWTSENLFLYGKFPTLHGVPLAMSLKKICRAYYLANEEIMTLDCSLATIQSNAMAACMSDVTSFVPYVIYKIQLLLALKAFSDYHVLLGKGAFFFESGDEWKFTTSEGTRYSYPINNILPKWKFLMVLSWFPKILGGLNVASWYDFLMRGFPDKVSSALTWIKHLVTISTDPPIRDSLRCIYQCHINPERNFVLLVEDPCALNLIVPVDARASIRQSVQELFENMTEIRNIEFSSLFKFSSNWDKKEFCNALCDGDILHPRFLHDVAAATLAGYVDGVVSKVSKASTINKIALKTSNRDPGIKIEAHEKNYMKYLLWKTSTNNPHRSYVEHPCPTEQSRCLRLLSWNKVLEGVSVPHPMAFLEFRDCSRNPTQFDSCDRNFIMISLPESFCNGELSQVHALGGSPPYLGSETKEKLGADPSRQVFGKEPLISRPLKLLRVINWFVPPNSNAEKVIYKLLTSVSNLDPSEYVSREMGITGSESHRYRDQALKHGVMSSNMYTLGSHMHISTDPWIKYTRGAENYTINYQAILCTLQALVGGHLFQCHDDGAIPAREYHFHECCLDCIIPLTEEFHDFNSDRLLGIIPSCPENPYLWVEEVELSLKYKTDPQLILKVPEMSHVEYLAIENKREILNSWVAESVSNEIHSLYSLKFGPRLLDSKDYPRVMYKKLSVKELWEEVANSLIAKAGIKYTSGEGMRVAYPGTARELAADDIMKCSSGSMMGIAMFYTWPGKFAEIFEYDKGSLFPETSPPTLSSACSAMQANLRNIIRKCRISAPHQLILSRTNKFPVASIKSFWYRIVCSEGQACPMCLKVISNYDPKCELLLAKSLRCSLGHRTITNRMMRIQMLTASEDRVLKDCHSFEPYPQSLKVYPQLVKCPATMEWATPHALTIDNGDVSRLYTTPSKCLIWQYHAALPTNTKCRVYEILSIIKYETDIQFSSHGVIMGDGLGTSSRILSSFFPDTHWLVMTLHDSERAIPQSYPHPLIPENPVPNSNLNYSISKMLYNDISSDGFVEQWSQWIQGGVCWFEIETQGEKLPIFSNLLKVTDWDLIILRTDFVSYEEGAASLSLFYEHSHRVRMYITGSMDVQRFESLFILERTTISFQRAFPITTETYSRLYFEASVELYAKAESLFYAEYLSKIEDLDELSGMIKRCDYWFSIVGITHLLSCTKWFTPIWWDLQTGRIPSSIRELGYNKAYYMYQSDMIALQARLVSLAISLLYKPEQIMVEMLAYTYWSMEVTQKNKKIIFKIRRSHSSINYGPDHHKMLKFIPILRKLNFIYKRFWKEMPEVITFHTHYGSPGFWISNLSQCLPVDLPICI
ncbi:TPA_asm: L [Coptis gammacytorhabdovirus 1]|nr:TPA_asm: L [Coptis gammacytorhabdovirus 1]